jgi:hypothetical protein
MSNLEDRIERLEKRTVHQTARINVIEKAALTALAELILQMDDPLGYLAQMKQLWLGRPSMPQGFHGADPAYLDLISAEQDMALADMVRILEGHIGNLVERRSSPPEDR